MLASQDPRQPVYWMIQCDVIAGSASYVVNGYPDAQVTVLRDTLRRTLAQGMDWRKIYTSVYESWHTRRPHFPQPDSMAALIDQQA